VFINKENHEEKERIGEMVITCIVTFVFIFAICNNHIVTYGCKKEGHIIRNFKEKYGIEEYNVRNMKKYELIIKRIMKRRTDRLNGHYLTYEHQLHQHRRCGFVDVEE
jgi:hypothetical protein